MRVTEVLHRVARAAAGAAVAWAIGLAAPSGAWAQAAQTIKPFSPQPSMSALKPGLAVAYYNVKVRYMDELIKFTKHRPGTPGAPLVALNYSDRGPGAHVLGTNQPELVGAIIDGLMQFDVPGTYELAAVVNDGLQLQIGGTTLILEETIRPSDFTESAFVNIVEPGWYQLHIKYFQRKGTAALELWWKRPDQTGDLVMVPAEAYCHITE